MTKRTAPSANEVRQSAPVVSVLSPMTPEDAATVTTELLETCRTWIRRYIVVSDEQAVIMAAWLLHSYAFDAAETTPYIHITAPEKACGKSYLMEALQALAAAPIRSGGMTAAALVRTIHARKPTIFLDEMDAQLGGNKEYAEAVRGILNEGFRKGGMFYKCNATTHEIEEFNAYCPKCFAGIGQLPDTVASRSIRIEMRRKLPGESVEPLRQKAVKNAALPIKAKLEAWEARGAADLLCPIEPAPIAGLSDRQNDIAEPLLCIAQLGGNGWLQRLTVALQAVFKAASVEDGSLGVTVLADIRAVFDERKTDTIPSAVLAGCLCKIEGRQWADCNHGNGMTANNLAWQLRKFRIYSQSIRVGDKTPKGYRRGDFEDAWSRYCPLPALQNATSPQPASTLNETAFSKRHTTHDVADAKSGANPHEHCTVAGVAVENPENLPLNESIFTNPARARR